MLRTSHAITVVQHGRLALVDVRADRVVLVRRMAKLARLTQHAKLRVRKAGALVTGSSGVIWLLTRLTCGTGCAVHIHDTRSVAGLADAECRVAARGAWHAGGTVDTRARACTARGALLTVEANFARRTRGTRK